MINSVCGTNFQASGGDLVISGGGDQGGEGTSGDVDLTKIPAVRRA